MGRRQRLFLIEFQEEVSILSPWVVAASLANWFVVSSLRGRFLKLALLWAVGASPSKATLGVSPHTLSCMEIWLQRNLFL